MLSAKEAIQLTKENKEKIRAQFEKEHSDIFYHLEGLILAGAKRTYQHNNSAAVDISYKGILSKEEFIMLLDILEYKYKYNVSWQVNNLTINYIYW